MILHSKSNTSFLLIFFKKKNCLGYIDQDTPTRMRYDDISLLTQFNWTVCDRETSTTTTSSTTTQWVNLTHVWANVYDVYSIHYTHFISARPIKWYHCMAFAQRIMCTIITTIRKKMKKEKKTLNQQIHILSICCCYCCCYCSDFSLSRFFLNIVV